MNKPKIRITLVEKRELWDATEGIKLATAMILILKEEIYVPWQCM